MFFRDGRVPHLHFASIVETVGVPFVAKERYVELRSAADQSMLRLGGCGRDSGSADKGGRG